MDIDYFLMTKLFDLYELMCISNGYSYLEYDTQFMNKEGIKITEKEYFFKHRAEIICPELLDALYYELISENTSPILLDRIISYLASNYHIYNYNKANCIARYFEKYSFSSIKELFITNEKLGIDLLKSYFKNLGNSKTYETNKEKVLNSKPEVYEKFYFIYSNNSSETLSTLTRNIILNLFDYYMDNNCEYYEGLNNVWEFFINDKDPLHELEQYGIHTINKVLYKRFILGSLLGDVYEDVCNNSIIKTKDINDRLASVLPVILATTGVFGIPKDLITRNKILEHFIILQDHVDKRKINRDVTYMEGRIRILKKVNPLYEVDELTF